MTTVQIYTDGNGNALDSGTEGTVNWANTRAGDGVRLLDLQTVYDFYVNAIYIDEFSIQLQRNFLSFDTSDIPESATISAVTLHIFEDEEGDSCHICAVKGTQANPITTSDWGSWTGDSYGELVVESSLIQGYTIEFNAQGISDIVKGGITKIAIIDYPNDFLNVAPSTGNWFEFASYYTVGTDKPYLEITYTEAADTTPPVITRLGEATVNLTVGDSYTDAGATATDDVDGDITGSIVTVNPVNTAVADTYTVTYNVSDAALNPATEVTRTVIVSAAVSTLRKNPFKIKFI